MLGRDRRTRLAAAAVAGLALGAAAQPAHGQVLGLPIGVDARAEIAFPVADFADVAGTGAGFSLGVAVGIMPGFAIYGNYSMIRFGGGWTGDEASDATDTGFALGLSAAFGDALGLSPWVGAGLLFHELQVRGTQQGVEQDLGFEVGGGVSIPLTAQLRLTPALNYRHYGATIPAVGGLTARELNVQYLSLGVGLNFSF